VLVVVSLVRSAVAAMASKGSKKHLDAVNSMATSGLKGSKVSRFNLQQTFEAHQKK